MREVPGQRVAVNDRTVYAETSGTGQDWVVFEAGGGCGRTCWDRLTPLLADHARLVAYDRAGRGRSGPATGPLGIDDLAADLVALTRTVVPDEFVLVAHSMGGLVARRAAELLGARLRGLLLVDPTPETAPVYDTWDQTTSRIDRGLAVAQTLSRFRPLARLFHRDVGRLFSPDTSRTMLAEDVTPAGIAQTRAEMRAVAAAIPRFRDQPPTLPACPTIVLSAARAARGRERQHAALLEHQRRYADSLPHGRHDVVDSAHLIQAEQPRLVTARIQELLQATR